ncbi:ornithine carbamoyltransferase [Gemmatimonadota bacterium]
MADYKDFLDLRDRTREELLATLDFAVNMKTDLKAGKGSAALAGKTLAMVFQKPSARTRISFEVGMWQLGGYALYLAPTDIGLGKRESVADIARVLARYNDGIMARVFEHDHVLELGRWSDVPVVNGLTDYNHPCQVLADLQTILEHKSTVEGIKVAFVGDGNNLSHSWLNAASRLEFDLSLAIPEGYDPDATTYSEAAAANNGITLTRDPREAVEDADVIYTDTWTSMGQEEEAAKRREAFTGFTVDADLVGSAKDDVIVMHCLPAHRGEEITDEIMDGPHSVVFDEAENRLHAQKAVLVELMGR